VNKSLISREYKIFLQLLYQARVGSHFNQSELAKHLKVPQSYISKIESGERRVDIVELSRICKVLGISLSDFARKFEKNSSEAK
jgi:transcriptional regulator with XRE-family HTH domain